MDHGSHKEGLYRWKRQEPRTHSRSQNVTSKNDIQNWIREHHQCVKQFGSRSGPTFLIWVQTVYKDYQQAIKVSAAKKELWKVEEASNHAAEQVFGTNHSSGRARGRAATQMTREHVVDSEHAYTEAKELLSEWMEDKVDLTSEPIIDSQYDDDSWQRYAVESDVKREWDNLLANNLEDYELPLMSKPSKRNSDIYNLDEDDAVAMVMRNMMDKQVVKKNFTKDLGLDPHSKHKDPRNKMELRHQQVKENREKRQMEIDKKRREQQNKKEAMHQAKQIVMREERDKEMKTRREEMEIRKEMNKIRKDMQEERRKVEEMKAREKKNKEQALMAAKVKVAWEEEAEEQITLAEQRQREENQRVLIQRLQELETRQAANNLKILHKHFSAWYNVVLERRLKMGKARATSDWKLLLRAWNAWRSYVRGRTMEKESRQVEQDIIETHRKTQIADNHSRTTLLRKYFIAWHIWVRSEQERRELEQAQSSTRNKMMSLLEAAASGKLWQGKEEEVETSRSSSRSSSRLQSARGRQEKRSTADKINSLFENTRNIPISDTTSVCSTERSESNTSDPQQRVVQSRIPTEPWQITKKHLNLSPQEIASLGSGEPGERPENMDSKVLKRFGKQPWHKPEVSTYEHRHAVQKKILEDQKKQIREQQRMIEELQFKSTHQELQRQLTEQKLTLQQISQQVNIEPDHDQSLQPTSKQQDGSSKIANGKNTIKKQPGNQNLKTTHPKSAPVSQKGVVTQSDVPDTSRTGATTNRTSRPLSSRTDVSKPGSYASTASEKSKYLQVLKNMEERSAERARIKAERDERRRKQEEEKLAQLEAEEAERLKEIEDEKRRKAEAYREKKRMEKQREIDRQVQEEKLKQQNAMADEHYRRSIMKYRGIVPMRKLVAMAKQQQKQAEDHFQSCLKRKTLLCWHQHVREEWREREELADQMFNFLLIKHCFQSWRFYKHHQVIQEHRAVKHYSLTTKSKVFQVWRDYANEEKVASWEKERRAREHYRLLLMRRYFHAWRSLPDAIIKEKEKEKRRWELRQKVAALLPDFEPSKSVEKSTDFL